MDRQLINISFQKEEAGEPSRTTQGGGGGAVSGGGRKRTRKGVLSFGGACGCCRASKAKCCGTQPRCSRCVKYQKSCEYSNPQRRPQKSSAAAALLPPPPPTSAKFIVPSHPLLVPPPLPKVASSAPRPRLVKKERSPSFPLTPPSSDHSYDHHPRPQWGYVPLHSYSDRIPSPPSSTSTSSFVHAPPPPAHSVPSHRPHRETPPLFHQSPTTYLNYHYHPYYTSLTLAPIVNSNSVRSTKPTRLPSPSLLFPELGLSYRARLPPPPPYQERREKVRWDGGRGGEFGSEGGLLKALGL
ncbi:hypothetical protein BDY24DRAFT_105900 [Mrakia frigida]|uniref:Zn(II)2Cys6 transcription factor domain-containing protein n=1 Tax=Mrakia frigida TaxID=29902 RepID=UPI003FCC0B06